MDQLYKQRDILYAEIICLKLQSFDNILNFYNNGNKKSNFLNFIDNIVFKLESLESEVNYLSKIISSSITIWDVNDK